MEYFRVRLLAALLALLTLGGCSSLVSGLTSQMANDLADSILNSEDIDTVREGIPAYLLLIDSFLRSSPDSEELLLAASNLNGSFAVLVDDEARIKLLADKSIRYAEQAACAGRGRLCGLRAQDFKRFEQELEGIEAGDVGVAYALAVAWVGWIQANSADWAAIAELGKAKLLMQQVIELDETYENGGPHLYMGGMETILPASLGGRPEKGREHFERAIEINDDYLMTKVIFAEQYARLVFDQSLHDQLLRQVLDADPVVEGMTLTNRIAQERAAQLLETSSEYF